MTTVYLTPQDLLLDGAMFDSNGRVTSGYVVNGAWFYRSNGTHWFAYRDKSDDLLRPVTNREANAPEEIVFVPREHRGHWTEYNEPMEWARTQPKFTGCLQEEIDRYELEAINFKKNKPVSGFEDFDDDIAF